MFTRFKLAVILLLVVIVLGSLGFHFYTHYRLRQSPDILLVTVDTLRADALNLNEGEVSNTPFLRDWSKQASIYTHATTPIPLTKPALASLFSGQHPRRHGVLNNAIALTDTKNTLAQLLKRRGYMTAAFVGVRLLGPESGLHHGFGTYWHPEKMYHFRSQRVITQAINWMHSVKTNAPSFIWVHLFDPHQPYDPPAEYRHSLPPKIEKQYPKIDWQQLNSIAKANQGHISADIFNYAKDLYHGEIQYTDTQLKFLFQTFYQRQSKRKKIVVLTADHGECFENGVYFEHADCLYDGAVRIPLLIQYPKQKKTVVINQPVQLLDIMPTLLGIAAVSLPQPIDGIDLMQVKAMSQAEGRYTLIQRPFFESKKKGYRAKTIQFVGGQPVKTFAVGSHTVGLVNSQWKYVKSETQEELYQCSGYCSEENNLISKNPKILDYLRKTLTVQLKALPLRIIEVDQINFEMRETLRVLGYLYEE